MVYPKDIVTFKIANSTLGLLVDNNQVHLAFLLHMLQTSAGYPLGMSNQQAVAMMNQINVLGKILIFPDDKSTVVSITNDTQSSWNTYTENNGGNSAHALVIGPNRPVELNGVRQIAVRGEKGTMLINIAKRDKQRIV
jgi:hypothetical protein